MRRAMPRAGAPRACHRAGPRQPRPSRSSAEPAPVAPFRLNRTRAPQQKAPHRGRKHSAATQAVPRRGTRASARGPSAPSRLSCAPPSPSDQRDRGRGRVEASRTCLPVSTVGPCRRRRSASCEPDKAGRGGWPIVPLTESTSARTIADEVRRVALARCDGLSARAVVRRAQSIVGAGLRSPA